MNQEVPVVILCGGMGTRLREETEYRPKPLVEVGGRPILWHIMKLYGSYGFKRFILCLGYKGEMIKQYFLNYRLTTRNFTLRLESDEEPVVESNGEPEEWTITFADTGTNAMTGSRVKRIERYIESDELDVADLRRRGLQHQHVRPVEFSQESRQAGHCDCGAPPGSIRRVGD